MTIEEITQTLQTVASNQAKHDEMHERHKADIAEMDRMLNLSLQSQNRFDERLAIVSDIMHTLADRQLKNEELFAENEKRFAELAEAQKRAEFRMEKLEGNHELLESFVIEFRRESNGYFAETDKKLVALAESQARTDEQMKRTDEQIKALIAAQTRTDERLRSLLERNGSAKPKARAKKAAKKSRKRGDQ